MINQDKILSKNHFVIRIACIVSIFVIGYIDYITGYEATVILFYFAPIIIAAWLFNRSFSILITLLCAIVWYLANLLLNEYSKVLILYWNTATHVIVFFIIWFATSRLKTAFNTIKELNLNLTKEKDRLTMTVARLELLNQELQEFAFIAAHDLQEPLRKIQTFCNILKTKCAPKLDSTEQKYLDRVFNSSDRMRQLLKSLLEFSRAAGKPEPFKKIDLDKIVQEVTEFFEEKLKESGGVIETENMPDIEACETQMLSLFQNLIGNALKYRSGKSPQIKVYSKLNDERECEIFVQDNGIGFDQHYSELIFKPFQQLRKKDYEGVGMGLTLCRKIVERHSGSIRAESEPGKGSIFIIRLPLKQSMRDGI